MLSASSRYIIYVFIQPWQLLAGTAFFLVLIAGILVFTFTHLFKRSRRRIYKSELQYKFQDLISHLAVSESENELQELINSKQVELKLVLTDSYARHLLIKELVTAAKCMNGAAQQNICRFYSETGLVHDTLSRIKNKNWSIRAKAIQTLAHLGQKKYITRIYRLTNSNNEFVRHEARIAVVKLTGFKGLRFLNVISYPLTEWQQLHLLHELSTESISSNTDINRWLHSENTSVVEFALRLVEIYRLHDLHDKVVPLLKHPNEFIQIKAIHALCEIQCDSTAQKMIENFRKENNPVQFAILKALQKTGSETEIPFLSRCLLRDETDFKMAAAKAIRKIKSDGLEIIGHTIDKTQQPWPVLLLQLEQGEIV